MQNVKLHSHITDCLPQGHPWQYNQVTCIKCERLVHAGNDECMKTWLECCYHGEDNVAICMKCVSEEADKQDYGVGWLRWLPDFVEEYR